MMCVDTCLFHYKLKIKSHTKSSPSLDSNKSGWENKPPFSLLFDHFIGYISVFTTIMP